MLSADREEQHTALAALYLFLFMTFIVLAICIGNYLHAHQFYYLPESGAVVLLGLVCNYTQPTQAAVPTTASP